MKAKKLGFAGLGNMGGPMAANVASAGFDLTVYDKAGTEERAPKGSRIAHSISDLAATCETIFLSLPDGKVATEVARQVAEQGKPAATCVIDLSTVGVEASKKAFDTLAKVGIQYIDAPVSGGKSGAVAGTITIIWGGPASLMESHRSVLEAMAKNIFHVGDQAGQGQSMKLLNNFLSAMALTATSEAILYGLAQGLKMETMLEVLNVSTGRNTATSDKFPNQVATGKFAAGFYTALMTKDLKLYLESVRATGTPKPLIELLAGIWKQADETLPGSDFTQIYQYVRDRG